MKKTFKLASVLLKCSPGSRMAEKEKMMIMGVCMIPIMYFLFRGGVLAEGILGALDGDGLVLQVLLFVVSIVLFVTGLASCINSFYLSSNLETLLVMPYTAGQITGAKIIVAASYEYYISILVLLPVMIGYGVSGGFSLLYWVGTILAVVLFPIVPLSYSAILAILVMRFVGAARNRGSLRIVGAIAAFAFITVFQIAQNTVKDRGTADLQDLLGSVVTRLEHMTMIFPNINFYVRSMMGGNVMGIVIGTVIILAIFAVFLITARTLYFSGALRMQDGGTSGKKLTSDQIAREMKPANVVNSFMKKELRTIRRTPAAYMSCLLATFGWPILIIIPMLFSRDGMKDISSVLNMMVSGNSLLYTVFMILVLTFAVTAIVAGTNAMAVTSISREGISFLLLKQMPIPYRTQLKAKRRAAFIVCFLGSGGYLMIAEIILAIMFGFPWWGIPVSLIFNVLMLSAILDFQMFWGLLHPHLVWESETDMFSKSRIGMVIMIIAIVVGVTIVVVAGPWASHSSMNPWIFAGAVAVILAVIAFVMNHAMYGYGEKKMASL